jgi:hypothetical protein
LYTVNANIVKDVIFHCLNSFCSDSFSPKSVVRILFAEKKAKLKEKYENAKNFLKAGADINIIASGTGLSMEEVERLRAEINK